MSTTKKFNVYRLTGLAILSAIIIVLQIFTTFVKFGPFSITLALIPMVVGAAMYGIGAGAYLGGVLGVVVTIMCMTGGDVGGAMVWAANPFLCALMCVLKTTLAGLCAGAIYKALSRKNQFIAVLLAAIAAPIVNTGTFIIGMLLFFREVLALWAGGTDTLTYIILGIVGVNFLVELGVNIVLSPIVVKIIGAVNKTLHKSSIEEIAGYDADYIFSFLVPLVGFILGAILLSKDEEEKKTVGKSCIMLAILSILIYALIIGLLIILL